MENKTPYEQMAKILTSLTDEQKEQAKACETMDELTACLGKLGVALPDELLDGVAGGMSELEYIEFYSNVVMPMIDRLGIGHGDWRKQDELEQKLLKQYSPDKRLSDYIV